MSDDRWSTNFTSLNAAKSSTSFNTPVINKLYGVFHEVGLSFYDLASDTPLAEQKIKCSCGGVHVLKAEVVAKIFGYDTF